MSNMSVRSITRTLDRLSVSRPTFVVLCGAPGTGKSLYSRQFAEQLRPFEHHDQFIPYIKHGVQIFPEVRCIILRDLVPNARNEHWLTRVIQQMYPDLRLIIIETNRAMSEFEVLRQHIAHEQRVDMVLNGAGIFTQYILDY